MSYLQRIEQRHRPDRWRDIIFVAAAVLLIALAIGSVTSKVVGPVTEHEWTLTVLEGNLEVNH